MQKLLKHVLMVTVFLMIPRIAEAGGEKAISLRVEEGETVPVQEVLDQAMSLPQSSFVHRSVHRSLEAVKVDMVYQANVPGGTRYYHLRYFKYIRKGVEGDRRIELREVLDWEKYRVVLSGGTVERAPNEPIAKGYIDDGVDGVVDEVKEEKVAEFGVAS